MDSAVNFPGRLDWYGVTLPANEAPPRDEILAVLRSALSKTVTVARMASGNGVQGWATEDRLLDYFGQRICGVLYGGHNAVHGTHLVASGVYTPAVATVIRGWWPHHAVSRADVAIDLDGAGCWDMLYAMLMDVSRKHGLSWRTIGDFRTDRDVLAGRTVYVGARQSRVVVRCYEKGKQLLAQRRVGEAPVSLDHCRLELEVKPPNKAAKMLASRLSPAEFWGCSAGSREILSRALTLDVGRVCMTARKESDARRAIRHMAVQYRLAMETVIAEEAGDDTALLKFIREVWTAMDAEKRSL